MFSFSSHRKTYPLLKQILEPGFSFLLLRQLKVLNHNFYGTIIFWDTIIGTFSTEYEYLVTPADE